MIENREVSVAVCDNCGTERISDLGVPPAGYHGVVDHYPADGKTPTGAHWYACGVKCIRRAMFGQLGEARGAGTRPVIPTMWGDDTPSTVDSQELMS